MAGRARPRRARPKRVKATPRGGRRGKATAHPKAPGKASGSPKAKRRAGEGLAKHLVRPAKSRRAPKTAGPASTESDRFHAIHSGLERRLTAHFPDAQSIFTYGMHGWKVPRRRHVEWTSGTMDPNWLAVLVAERKAGITLHVWNPVDPQLIQKMGRELGAAGFKAMVGCLQFMRKGAYPLDAVDALLGRIRRQMDEEAEAPPTSPTESQNR